MDKDFNFVDFFAYFNVLEVSIATALGASTYNFIKSLNEQLLYPIISGFFSIDNLSRFNIYFRGETIQAGLFLQELISFLLVVGVIVILIKYLFKNLLLDIVDKRTSTSIENAESNKKIVEQNKEIIDKLSYFSPYSKNFGRVSN